MYAGEDFVKPFVTKQGRCVLLVALNVHFISYFLKTADNLQKKKKAT